MVALLAAVVLAAAPPACSADLTVTDPRLKVVRARDKTLDNYIVTVNVKNVGPRDQTAGIEQRLDVLRDGKPIGSQPIPAIGAGIAYAAAFRLQLPHARQRPPLTLTFHYVLTDGHDPARENCAPENDLLTATLR